MKRKFFTFKPFIDTLFCCLLMLVAILFLLKTEEEKTKMRPPNVLYEVILTWDGNSEDVDLYVRAPSGHTVAFNNRAGGQGSLISLDHDALGKRRNNSLTQGQEGVVTSFNEEVVSFRGVVEGENIVTVHVYAKRDDVPTKATIKLIKIKPFREVGIKEREFSTTGQEKVAFRFKTDKEGRILEVNELPASLLNPLGE